jgi:hypothetical protein
MMDLYELLGRNVADADTAAGRMTLTRETRSREGRDEEEGAALLGVVAP